jgi:tRNA(Ile)-lysidine synthase TilS/MesJ
MLLVLSLYFGSIFYLVKKVIETRNKINEDTLDIISNIILDNKSNELFINKNLNIEVDKENVIYKAFMLEVNKNEMDITKQVLVCCTGDEQSMALLAIASNVFNHVHVLLINHDETNTMKEFIEDICDFNEFTMHCNNNTVYNTTNNKSRYEYINEICCNNNIKYVFEGHDMTNYSNTILNDIFNNVATQQIDPKGHINNNNTTDYIISKPFLLIDNITILKFISYYNIPVDNSLTHIDYSNIKKKSMFNDMDCYTSIIYPDWRINLIDFYSKKTSVDTTLIESNCFKGKYGFLVYHDFNKISFIAFKRVLNNLCKEYNFCKFDNSDYNEYYLTEESISYFINDDYDNKINEFEENFTCDTVSDLIDNNSENSFEELDNSISNDDDDKEYILRVNLNNETPAIKLVKDISDNFREEYLDGIIYINIIDIDNNQFYIYDINTAFVHDD